MVQLKNVKDRSEEKRKNICEKKIYLRDHLVVIKILWFPRPFYDFSIVFDVGGLEHGRY
jgi:hypothetical protein